MITLIISSFGPTKNYPDQEMMKKTLSAFITSLQRQTDRNFKLFISCHDVPKGKWINDSRIEWCSLMCDEEMDFTLVPKIGDPPEYEKLPYHSKMQDMTRKTMNSALQAGLWAKRQNLSGFWMLRMDSDDLLAKDMVETLNSQDPDKIGAVFNRRCHIFDTRSKEIGIYDYAYPTTCNAMWMKIEDGKIPNWFYLCTDHTRFNLDLRRDKIPFQEIDWSLCITSNSGNTISGRGRIEENTEARITKIELTERLIERYGLDSF